MAHFDTTVFVQEHRRPPRGRGGWIFRDAESDTEHTHAGTYTEAKRSATAANPAVATWVVLP